MAHDMHDGGPDDQNSTPLLCIHVNDSQLLKVLVIAAKVKQLVLLIEPLVMCHTLNTVCSFAHVLYSSKYCVLSPLIQISVSLSN